MNTQINTTTPRIAIYSVILAIFLFSYLSPKAEPVVKNPIPDSLRQAYGLIQTASFNWNVSTDSAITKLQEYAGTPLGKVEGEKFFVEYQLKEAKIKMLHYQFGVAGMILLFIGFFFLAVQRVRKLQAKHDTELLKINLDRAIEEELFTNNANPDRMFNHSDPNRLAKLAGELVITKITQRVKPSEFFTFLQSLGMVENSRDRNFNTMDKIPYRKGIREHVLKNINFSEVRKWRDALVFTVDGEQEVVKNFESVISSTFLAGMLKDDKAYQPVH